MADPRVPAAVVQLHHSTGGGVVVTSLQDLEHRLDVLHEAATGHDDPLLVSLQIGERDPAGDLWPPTLDLVLGRESSALHYDNSALPEANFTSIGDRSLASDDPDSELAVACGDDFAYFYGENVIPVEYAREAARQFWPAGDRPTVCGWD